MTAILEAAGVTKHFGRRRTASLQALSDISVGVQAGETLSIVGESGSGKSTLARCLTALHDADAGRVLYRDRDLAAMTRAERLAFHRRVQLVFQNPASALNPRMTVAQTLAEALHVHRICRPAERPAEMRRLLACVQLPDTVLNRRPHEFSGGQLQRIALARALSVRPELIVADEIVSALDVSVQAQIVNLLITLQHELGLALVFIAHDLRLVRHISHRVAVMYRGHLVELSASKPLFDAPAHPYTRLLVASAPTLDPAQRLRATVHERRAAESAPTACIFQPRCPLAVARCTTETPRLRLVAAGRSVACHRVADAD